MAEPAPPPEQPPIAEPVIVRDADGNDFQVDASELDAYVRSGQYAVSPQQLNPEGVPVRDVDGTQRYVPPEEAQAKISSFAADAGQSAVVAQQEEERRYGGVLQGARAATAGALRGVTLGASDQLLTALDPEMAPYLAGLERARPTASLLGEVAGIGGALLATGGSGAGGVAARLAGGGVRAVAGAGELAAAGAGRLAATAGLAEGGLAARALGAAARGAVEMGAFEAGREVSQAALQQRELEASKVASALGHGALIGGVLGGAIPLAGAALSGATGGVGRLVGRVAPEGQRPFAEKALAYAQEKTLKGTGGTSKEIGKILDATPGLRQAADDILIKDAPRAIGKAEGAILSRAEMQAGIEAVQQKVGAQMGAALRKLDANARGIGADISGIVAKAREQVLTPLESNVFAGAEAKAVAEQIIQLEKLQGYRVGFESLHELSSQLGKVIRKNPTAAATEDLKAFRSLIEDEIITGANRVSESVGGNLAGQYANAKTRYAAAKLLEDAVSTGVKAEAKNLTFSLSSMIAGGSGSSLGATVGGAIAGPVGAAIGGAVGGVGGAVLANLNKRFGDQVVSQALRSYAQGTPQIAAISGLVDRAVSTSVGGYLKAAAGGVSRAARGEATGTTMRAALASPAVQNRARANELGKALFGAPEPEAKRTTTASTTVRLAGRAAPQRGEVTDAQVKRAVTAIQGSQAQRRAAIERVMEMAPEMAPELRGQLAASERAHAYLLSKIPATSNTSATLTPQAEVPRMTQAQRDELLTAVRVVTDPLSVLDSLQAGTISRAEVDALKATAPELYASIQSDVQAQLDARTEPLPYRKALELSTLLGVVGHPSLDPAVMRGIQASFGPQVVASQQAQQPAQNAPVRKITRAGDWSVRREEV